MNQPAPLCHSGSVSLPADPHVLGCGVRGALRLCGLSGPQAEPVWVPVRRRNKGPRPVKILGAPRA